MDRYSCQQDFLSQKVQIHDIVFKIEKLLNIFDIVETDTVDDLIILGKKCIISYELDDKLDILLFISAIDNYVDSDNFCRLIEYIEKSQFCTFVNRKTIFKIYKILYD